MEEKNLNFIFNDKIPKEIQKFLNCVALRRLMDVGMHCGLEYTSFPFYKDLTKYSRYQHSINVALIIYHFTSDITQSLSGLFHDIATPCFAHVIDFLNGDYEKQISTEEMTVSILENSLDIKDKLDLLNVKISQISNYHLYPIADNDLPKLSSDRLEYTLHNFYNYNLTSLTEIKEMYDDLIVSSNEYGENELVFKNKDLAIKFAYLALKNAKIYVSDEDRYAMEYLARILKSALLDGIICSNDLYLTEPKLINKLLINENYKEKWKSYLKLSKVQKTNDKINEFSYLIHSKKRVIDPYVYNCGRTSVICNDLNKEIKLFKSENFDYYLTLKD